MSNEKETGVTPFNPEKSADRDKDQLVLVRIFEEGRPHAIVAVRGKGAEHELENSICLDDSLISDGHLPKEPGLHVWTGEINYCRDYEGEDASWAQGQWRKATCQDLVDLGVISDPWPWRFVEKLREADARLVAIGEKLGVVYREEYDPGNGHEEVWFEFGGKPFETRRDAIDAALEKVTGTPRTKPTTRPPAIAGNRRSDRR